MTRTLMMIGLGDLAGLVLNLLVQGEPVGRVVLAEEARGRGLGDPLMETALRVCVDRDVVIDAQTPLARWYESMGFAVTGEEFLDDGVAHLPMRLRQSRRG